jgi:hypothetical protein
MNKIDLIIDALSVAQNSVWSALNEQALAAARSLQAELAKPEQEPKLTDAGADTNITRGLEPKGSGMTDEQASDWKYKMICCLGISTSNSDINVVGLHKTVKELYEQGRVDEREAQVCCGNYDKCIKACTPRGRWLAEQELAKPEQEEPLSPVDIGVDVTPEGTHVVACYNRPDAVQEMFYSKFHPLAKPEQASTEPPDYVEPPTSDYHNGWEEGFEAAKNLFKGKNT